MLPDEIGFIFLYVAAFGFSDFLVKKMNLSGIKYLMYYFLILIIGLVIIYFTDRDFLQVNLRRTMKVKMMNIKMKMKMIIHIKYKI